MSMVGLGLSRFRATLCLMLLILIAGLFSRSSMVIEAFPNPSVPVVLVILAQEGASPEDGARLLVRPMEKELRSLDGLKEIRSVSRETVSYIIVEFDALKDTKQARLDVQAAVDRAKAELPSESEEPIVEEISADNASTIVVAVSGTVEEREIFRSARLLKREIEAIPDVLEVDMNGAREEQIEILIDPAKLEYYAITSNELYQAIQGNNVLIPAGQIETLNGRFSVKVPSLIENREDVLNIPIRASVDAVVTLGDVASIHRSFKSANGISTVNGERAITLNVKKRTDANDIEVTRKVRALAGDLEPRIPLGVNVDFLMDQSDFSIGMINEMQGNILTAMVLVMIVVIASLGLRSGILVGAGVPFSLLFASIILLYIGFSFNFMVLFGMLLALGMLIDGAIVITEFADRKMSEGMDSREAYMLSVKRMLWPVTASTATTLAAFLPIMFWPGVAGEFMRYLPVTVFAVLAGSLLYALFFAPVLGGYLGQFFQKSKYEKPQSDLESVSTDELTGISRKYANFLGRVIHHPFRFLVGAITVLIMIFTSYSKFGAGVEFFVETEQILGEVSIRAQGNISVEEARKISAEIEKKVMAVEGVKVVYSIINPSEPTQVGPREPENDQIAVMLVETYKPEELGYSTGLIFEKIRNLTAHTPGIYVNAAEMEGGPPVGKPVQIQLTGLDRAALHRSAKKLRADLAREFPGLRDITDTTPLPGIEWSMDVDQARAAQLGMNVVDVGNAIQLITSGVKIGEYRPNDADDELDIRVRFPQSERTLHAIDRIKVNTSAGPTSISGAVKRIAKPAVDKVERINGMEYTKVLADVKEGYVADTLVKEITEWVAANPIEKGISVSFRGANEEQEQSGAFLAVAFLLALFLMFILLVTQFNSFYQAVLTLSSVILSTAGVLLGLMITQSLFSVIMTGVGIVALAGIVVNNNIVLIDTFNYMRQIHKDMDIKEAAISAATQRLRPVLLTTVTTILGLLPLATGLSIDLVNRTIIHGGVVGSFWVSLASSIVYGLVFSTVLTLAVTPTMLILPSEVRRLFVRKFGRGKVLKENKKM